ncbi:MULTISPECIES: hypothetical protein [unclassified Bradyrhizobium]|uniref:hypothetical protein n=1 Tax=unclassified Bradyrhizobium TaxID=2631580 RepID=UPI002916805E|nr:MULTISPECIES: hypothetical protein [unclassified Bradyrhizobium]
MPSPMQAAIAAASATHDMVMSDSFRYSPMKYGADKNAPTVVDPDRAVAVIRGKCGEYAARVNSGPFNQPGVKPERAGHASSRPYLSLRLSQLAYRPKQGDQVQALDDDGLPIAGQLFRVAEVLPSTPGFVRLDLNRI